MENGEIKKYLLTHFKNILKQPTQNIKHPFVVPGQGYANELWGWDSYWEALSLRKAFDVFTAEQMEQEGVGREIVKRHICGSVLDFLDAQQDDGFIPIMIADGGLFDGFFAAEHAKGTPLNQHLPFLCQSALNASEFCGDCGWFNVDKLLKYMCYFETRQYDERSGLFFWQDDIMIGIDNNPTVFYRPKKSSADIFLNCFIYLEYTALAQILEMTKDARASEIKQRANALKTAINAEMWDERDGIYYSQDLGIVRNECVVKGVALHSGLAPHWNTMPLKIRFWACFLPMYAGIADKLQAKRMCAHLTENDDLFAEYGIRTLAKNEKMYSLVKSQGNPSNWLGAVWVVANYCVYKGLARYGITDLADKLKCSTLNLLNKNLRQYGDFFESYHPDDGSPFMHAGFLSHNLPIVEMLK